MKTRKIEDQSTTEVYKFTAYCECCGKIVSTHSSTSDACYKPSVFLSISARRAKELLWLKGHDEALENASHEALQHLNQCEICEKLICDDCTVIDESGNGGILCKSCAAKKASTK